MSTRGGLFPKWLTVVLSVLGWCGAAILVSTIMSSIVIPRVIGRKDEARIAAAKEQERSLLESVEQFRVDCGRYPTAKESLKALATSPKGTEMRWRGPYVKGGVPSDPWGHSYVYQISSDGEAISITSYGSDGQPGGEGSTSETDIVDRVD